MEDDFEDTDDLDDLICDDDLDPCEGFCGSYADYRYETRREDGQ